jgi:hypothetical protein
MLVINGGDRANWQKHHRLSLVFLGNPFQISEGILAVLTEVSLALSQSFQIPEYATT